MCGTPEFYKALDELSDHEERPDLSCSAPLACWEENFHKLRQACCDLLSEMQFDEQNGAFSVDVSDGDEFERVVRSLPPNDQESDAKGTL